MLTELKSKTQRLMQKQDKYENEYKKKIEEFKLVKNYIKNIFDTLDIANDLSGTSKALIDDGVKESNVQLYLSEVEKKVKFILKVFEADSHVEARS